MTIRLDELEEMIHKKGPPGRSEGRGSRIGVEEGVVVAGAVTNS